MNYKTDPFYINLKTCEEKRSPGMKTYQKIYTRNREPWVKKLLKVTKNLHERRLANRFTIFKMTALHKKKSSKICNNHRKISLISHTGKIFPRILSKIFENEIEGVISLDSRKVGTLEIALH